MEYKTEGMRKVLIGFVWGVIVCALALWFVLRSGKLRSNGTETDTVTVTVVDTVTYLKPVVRDSVVVRYVSARMPVAGGTDTVVAHNAGRDSVEVEIAVTQKVYTDSTYTAWVSGWSPSLDSIKVYPRSERVTITRTIRQKARRWGVGIHAGMGVTGSGVQPYVGVGIHYTIAGF